MGNGGPEDYTAADSAVIEAAYKVQRRLPHVIGLNWRQVFQKQRTAQHSLQLAFGEMIVDLGNMTQAQAATPTKKRKIQRA